MNSIKTIILANSKVLAKTYESDNKVKFFIKADTWRTWDSRNRVFVREVEMNKELMNQANLRKEADRILKDIASGFINARDLRKPHQWK